MRPGSLVVFAILAVACGKDGPTSPSGRAESMTWTVDGASFVASEKGRSASDLGIGFQVVGWDCQSTANLTFSLPSGSGVGTYRIGERGVSVTWAPDVRSSSGQWEAPNRFPTPGTGSGSVTISAISEGWVSGTFEFLVISVPPNQDTSPKAIRGSFELSTSFRPALC